ncbi:LysR family transcriptional regulator [Agrobacterium tumefaciens]|uniref:HTH-type transcriptional regulator TtuA n=1 Tax=Agrobacterium tumefaciens TaxID=358 RepID=A0A4D7YZX8_AGRTU|nr:LysR family transcriptional regulator [Agrobacterium tumefaciens]QCL96484.1 LysR family transcriptional regulator [Agrobacterium tumefaciens]
MSINCEILDLRAFQAVVELASFHRAAEALHISQPALTRRIQKLEQAIGAPLLERTTRHVAPTAMGQEVMPLVRRMLEEFDGSLFAMKDGAQRRGLITMACVPTAAFYFLPTVIKTFSQQYPHIRLRIRDLTANEGLQAVARGEVEFGINLMGNSDPELSFEPLIDDPFVLAMRKDHPLAAFETIEWDQLEHYPLVVVDRSSGNRTLLDSALARHNLKLNWFYEVTHLNTSLGLVEAGLGISVLPRLATPQDDHPFLITRPIVNPVVSRTIGIVQRRSSALSPAAEKFVRMLLETWKTQ